ncbi:MAG: TIGR03905 family TSCPD domain-containing protein [Oscillospiraceae bacterium]|jgi:uncharacterized protein (TIGR03905 family)|nr:TIGR03905 family TSCPD domain-containing protein [Oscillospiraceae bacterium]
MTTHQYQTKGICPRKITIELEGETIRSVHFDGGCAGNLTGISKLVAGMNARDIIEKFKGTTCGYKKTSCPDQLSLALQEALHILE